MGKPSPFHVPYILARTVLAAATFMGCTVFKRLREGETQHWLLLIHALVFKGAGLFLPKAFLENVSTEEENSIIRITDPRDPKHPCVTYGYNRTFCEYVGRKENAKF